MWYYGFMADRLAKVLVQMEANPANIRFADLVFVCEQYFGEARKVGSHRVYKMPWAGDPRVNIQDDNGKAKAYQVRQVLAAIKKLEAERG